MSEKESDNDDLACWKITNCQKTSFCPAHRNPDLPCWEIASQLNDFRSRLNVCEDCLVYLALQGGSVPLSEEIRVVLEKKGICGLPSECPLPLVKCAIEG